MCRERNHKGDTLWKWRQEDWQLQASLGSRVCARFELHKSPVNEEMGHRKAVWSQSLQRAFHCRVRLCVTPHVVHCKGLPPFDRRGRVVILLSAEALKLQTGRIPALALEQTTAGPAGLNCAAPTVYEW